MVATARITSAAQIVHLYSPRGANVHLMHGSRVHTILPPKRHLSLRHLRAHGHGQQTETNRQRDTHTTLRPDIYVTIGRV